MTFTQKKKKNFSHDHLLTLTDNINGDNSQNHHIRCMACNKLCSGLTYYCSQTQCEYFLHKSCAELPEVINHPFHSFHHLTLVSHFGSYECTACFKTHKNFCFYCQRCDYCLGLACASLLPTIKCQAHPHHLLSLLDNIGKLRRCNACKHPCDDDDDVHVLRCVPCNFNLQIFCHPSALPPKIKHRVHVDELTLTTSPVQIEPESDEYDCDAFEKPRNFWEPVYYCGDCDYVAHVKCVISEVLLSINTEHQNGLGIKDLEVTKTKAEKKISANEVGDQDAIVAKLNAKIELLRVEAESLKAKLETVTTQLQVLEKERGQYLFQMGFRKPNF